MINPSTDLNDDLSDLLGGTARAPEALPQDEAFARIRAAAPAIEAEVHVETCPKCRGTGRFVGWSGRVLGPCFNCKGTGKVTYKTSAQARAKARQSAATRKVRLADEAIKTFEQSNPAEYGWMLAEAPRFDFAAKMLEAVKKWGSLTTGQLVAVQKLVARSEERKAAREAAKAQQEAEAAPVSPQAILEAIGHGKASGLIWIKLRFEGFTIEEAKRHPGVLYIKRRDANRTYLGKVADGRYVASYDATAEDKAAIVEAFKDPLAALRAFGNKTDSCGVCGRQLTNADSIGEGIGPKCAERLGLDGHRKPGGIRVNVAEAGF